MVSLGGLAFVFFLETIAQAPSRYPSKIGELGRLNTIASSLLSSTDCQFMGSLFEFIRRTDDSFSLLGAHAIYRSSLVLRPECAQAFAPPPVALNFVLTHSPKGKSEHLSIISPKKFKQINIRFSNFSFLARSDQSTLVRKGMNLYSVDLTPFKLLEVYKFLEIYYVDFFDEANVTPKRSEVTPKHSNDTPTHSKNLEPPSFAFCKDPNFRLHRLPTSQIPTSGRLTQEDLKMKFEVEATECFQFNDDRVFSFAILPSSKEGRPLWSWQKKLDRRERSGTKDVIEVSIPKTISTLFEKDAVTFTASYIESYTQGSLQLSRQNALSDFPLN